MKSPAIITVFGSARPREGDAHYNEARDLGAALAAKGFTVCTGGYAGVMEAVSRGAKEAGGRTLGVTAKFFRPRANPWIDEEIRVSTWQDRLFELVRQGRGYVTCRGGTGTLAELAVVWEMLNKGVMSRRPVIVLGDYWRPIVECVERGEKGPAPLRPAGHEGLVRFAASPAEAAATLATAFRK
jgi:uncharacterized protein (TIGR00730 family)